jgi:hypothetical protein
MFIPSIPEPYLPVLLRVSHVKQAMGPLWFSGIRLLIWPGPMKAEDARRQIARSAGAPAPSQLALRRAGTPEEPLDTAARNQRPTAGPNHWADYALIHTAIADQTPVNLYLHDPQANRRERRVAINAFHPLINPYLQI